jgi:metal-dependent hydrolase (beta-lactamase superfamily II)
LRKISSGVGLFCKHRGIDKILDEVTRAGKKERIPEAVGGRGDI